jgi:hypothetical protein
MAMENPTRDMCKRLRSKGMFIEAEPDPTVPNTSDGFYWCTHTMNCLGPDGTVAGKDKCRAGRGCFESR